MMVDEWFRFWHDELLGGLSPNTKRNYRERYEHNINATKEFRKQSPSLSETYIDRRTGEERVFAMTELVFLNFRTGMPTKNSSYDTHICKVCDGNGIARFCMLALRHTYATRCIKSGMLPKTLQKLLGHASIKTTMDRYVHVTDESLVAGVKQFEQHRQTITA